MELHYRDRVNKSQTTREWAIQVGLLYREAKQRLDVELFLNEYPRWEVGAPDQSVILHEMFLLAAKWGWKEAERFICWGWQGSLPRPDLEADQSAIKLVGYRTSHKEIRNLYHSIYQMSRLTGPPPCGPHQRRKAIWDILSSLRSHLQWWVYPITTEEDTREAVNESWSRPRERGDPHEEALWEARAACQKTLEAAQVLESDIERLSQGLRDSQWSCPHNHSNSHQQSWSLDRLSRSLSRTWQERRVTFWEPEVEPDPEESRESYLPEPSIKDIETWLDWQACQLDTPCWWMELTAIPGMEDPLKLNWKIWASLIPEVRSRVFLGQGYTAPHALKSLTQNMFLPDKLSYQDMQQQPFLLTVVYARGLQYWAGILYPPVDPDFHPLVRSVLELEGNFEGAHGLLQKGCYLGLRKD